MADEPPEATPFAALGRGNGFPFCPFEFDVTDFDHWTTLSGYNKDSTEDPTEDDINNSLIAAMKMFWNWHGMSAEASFNNDQYNRSGTATDVELDTSLEPKTRVCPFDFYATNQDDRAGVRISNDPLYGGFEIVRMYNDSVFVGYGISGYDYEIAVSRAGDSGRARAYVNLYSARNELTSPSSYQVEDFAYVTLDGISFVARAYTELKTDDFTTESSATRNAAELTASASQTRSNGTTTYNYSAEANITGLTFYTYPQT